MLPSCRLSSFLWAAAPAWGASLGTSAAQGQPTQEYGEKGVPPAFLGWPALPRGTSVHCCPAAGWKEVPRAVWPAEDLTAAQRTPSVGTPDLGLLLKWGGELWVDHTGRVQTRPPVQNPHTASP